LKKGFKGKFIPLNECKNVGISTIKALSPKRLPLDK